MEATDFAAWLRGRRRALDLTQAALAEAIGCSTALIIKIEAGERRPSQQVAELLAERLGVPPTEWESFVRFARGVSVALPTPPAPPPPPTPEATAPSPEPRLFPLTKLRAPHPRADLLARPRLSAAVRSSIGRRRVVLISAPAGSGKTSLLAQALRSEGAPSLAWASCDSDDDDPARFMQLVAAALAPLAPGLEPLVRSAITNGRAPTVDEAAFMRQLVIILVNAIVPALTSPTALVLDDLHTLSNPVIFAALDYLADQLPPELTLVMASRIDPPLGLARLRARRDLLELRLTDLRFTREETTALLTEQLGLSLDHDQLGTLYTETEGWAAGIGIIATTLERLPPAEQNHFGGSMGRVDRELFDYLASEVLAHQDPFVRMFLLETAILQDLAPDVCAALTGRQDAAKVLDDLYRRNLFLVEVGTSATEERKPGAVPARQPIYRYHDLFRDFLRTQLARESPEWLRALHLRAARASSDPARRFNHLLAAAAYEEAAWLVADAAERLEEQGAYGMLRGWIEALPEQLREANPWLIYWQAVCLLQQGQLQTSSALFEQALARFVAAGDARGEGMVLAQTLGGLRARGDDGRVRSLIERGLACPIPDHLRVALLAARSLRSQWGLQPEAAEADIDVALALAEDSLDSRVTYQLVASLNPALSVYPGGLKRYDRMIRVAQRFPSVAESMPAQLLYMAVDYWRGRWDETRNRFEPLLDRATQQGFAAYMLFAVSFVLINSRIIMGDAETARRYHDWAQRLVDSAGDVTEFTASFIIQHYSLWVRACAEAGWLDKGREAVDRAWQVADRFPLDRYQAIVQLCESYLLLAEGDLAQAETLLHNLADLQQRAIFLRLYGDAALALSGVYARQGRDEEALAALLPRLAEYDRDRVVGRLMWEGRLVIAEPLRLAISRGLHTSIARRALSLLGEPVPPGPDARAGPTPLTLAPKPISRPHQGATCDDSGTVTGDH